MRIFNRAVSRSRLNPTIASYKDHRFEFYVKEFLELNSGRIDLAHAYNNVKVQVSLGRR